MPDPEVVSPQPLPAGTLAPEFRLLSADAAAVPPGKRPVPEHWRTLRDQAGSPVVLVFYPADFTPVCGDELAIFSEVLPLHGTLYRNQSALEADDLLGYADALRLDVERFAADLEQHRFAARVRRDLLSGARTGVNGTPTFFVNGHRHDGLFEADELVRALEGGRAAPGP